ncbi:hypothetical protein OCU04_007876 [Sclerotinia nivalis]|uniref:Uncharacterized protein n=1 Tax=Sclerotinia nivalis TaxID=352851 RepID=A0A9X0DIV7_9HELO|nr:hypothetical protein OCU04_007876 [Sclerotinia nivalis]
MAELNSLPDGTQQGQSTKNSAANSDEDLNHKDYQHAQQIRYVLTHLNGSDYSMNEIYLGPEIDFNSAIHKKILVGEVNVGTIGTLGSGIPTSKKGRIMMCDVLGSDGKPLVPKLGRRAWKKRKSHRAREAQHERAKAGNSAGGAQRKEMKDML